jgi:hypothetical protein
VQQEQKRDKTMAKIMVTFTATANEKEFSVEFQLDVAASQLVQGGMEWLENEAELWVMNDESLYNEFYAGAEQADMDATLEDIHVSVEDTED